MNMTHQEFAVLLKDPRAVKSDLLPELRELTDLYPYFAAARMLYLRALQQSGSIYFENELSRSVLYAADRKWLYYFVYPEKKTDAEQKYRRSEKQRGDYFSMLETVGKEGKDLNQSLKILAERLKKARLDVLSGGSEQKMPADDLQEEKIKKRIRQLMHERKYNDALEILKQLNLNNPKKSVYFADQIRFLEKIIENIKK